MVGEYCSLSQSSHTDMVEEKESGTLLARSFYTAGSKMTLRTQVRLMFLGQGSMPSPPFPVTTVLPKKKGI
jgi:hypothetical protein